MNKYTDKKNITAKKAAATKKKKLEQMPNWLKTATCTWIVPPENNLKRQIAIAMLDHKSFICNVKFSLGSLMFLGVIHKNGLLKVRINNLNNFSLDLNSRQHNHKSNSDSISKLNIIKATQAYLNSFLERKFTLKILIGKNNEMIRKCLERKLKYILNDFIIEDNGQNSLKRMIEYLTKYDDKDVLSLYKFMITEN